jgi:hypothetical protein
VIDNTVLPPNLTPMYTITPKYKPPRNKTKRSDKNKLHSQTNCEIKICLPLTIDQETIAGCPSHAYWIQRRMSTR